MLLARGDFVERWSAYILPRKTGMPERVDKGLKLNTFRMVLLSLFQAEFEARKSKEKLTNLDGENEVSLYLMVKYC